MSIPHDRYKLIFEHAQTGLLLADTRGIVLAANKAFCDISGYTQKELVNLIEIGTFVHPDDFKRVDKEYKDIIKAKISSDFIHEFRFVKKNRETIDAAATISFDENTGFSVITILDITDKKMRMDALNRRDAILESINYVSNKFLKSKSWKDVMPDAMKAIGQASQVSRIYCFENSVDPKTGLLLMNELFEWSYDKKAAQINNPEMQGLSYKEAGVLRWEKKLGNGEIVFADVKNIDLEEKNNMKMLDVKTSVIAPVFLNDRWWGFIGFDEMREERIWTKAEIDALGAAAGIIGSAIYKQESYEALIAYITESALRIKEPGTVVRDNILQIKKDILENIVSKESIAAKIDIQVKNLDQINKNIKEINKAIVEKRTEIPESYRQFISR